MKQCTLVRTKEIMQLKGMSLIWRGCCAIGSGLLLASAFPPVAGAEAAWVAFVPLLAIARCSPPGSAFKWGFLSGLSFWLPALAWLLKLGETGAPLPAAVCGWVALSAYCSIYFGAFAWLSAFLFNLFGWNKPAGEGSSARIKRQLIGVGMVLLLPVIWVGLEYLRSTLFTGFPWNTVGISQFKNLAIIQVAAWGGVYAVSAVVLVMNVALALTFFSLIDSYRGGGCSRVHFELMTGLLICAVTWSSGLRVVRREYAADADVTPVWISAIQPNIVQRKKWDADAIEAIYCALEAQTEYALMGRNLDLLIWPETALPAALGCDPVADDFIDGMTAAGVPILAGVLECDRDIAGNTILYNSSVLCERGGGPGQRYRKRHLVLFGEYLPFEQALPVLKRYAPLGFSCAAGKESTVLKLCSVPGDDGTDPVAEAGASARREVAFSSLICFEDVFAYLARDAALGGAEFLVNQTNDAWFDGTAAAIQHMSHCVFRCVENRLPAVRCANTGITCFIDAVGRIEDGLLLEKQGWGLGVAGFRTSAALVNNVPRRTIYTRYGDRVFGLPCGLFVAVLCVVTLIGTRLNSDEGEIEHDDR